MKPAKTTWYRLAAAVGRGLEHRVDVAPLIRFDQGTGDGALSGTVKPAIAGKAVVIQRLDGNRWKTVARTSTDARGRFRAALGLSGGTYRATVTYGSGYVQGRTPPLEVSPLIRLAAVLAGALALAPAAAAAPGTISVGLTADADRAEAVALIAAATDGELVADLGPLDALVLRRARTWRSALAAARSLPGVAYRERVTSSRRLAFVPNDPLASRQWYLGAIRAFDRWAVHPAQPPVRVAVIDSGIDAGHPEFAGRIAGMRSFVGTPARDGHARARHDRGRARSPRPSTTARGSPGPAFPSSS